MNKQDLKPCPFCGGHDLYFVTCEERYGGYETVGIFCNWCKQTVTLERNSWEGNNEETQARAAEAWNMRVDE